MGELGVYRQILSAFSSEINKMSKLFNKYAFNPESKRLHLLGEVRNDLMLEVYLRIEQEELFHSQLFKDYVVGYSRKRLGELLQRVTFNMPGGFSYSADSIITQGQELIDKTIEQVKGQSPSTSFFRNESIIKLSGTVIIVSLIISIVLFNCFLKIFPDALFKSLE